jgi:hypothetical protein
LFIKMLLIVRKNLKTAWINNMALVTGHGTYVQKYTIELDNI